MNLLAPKNQTELAPPALRDLDVDKQNTAHEQCLQVCLRFCCYLAIKILNISCCRMPVVSRLSMQTDDSK